jgi:hypothetical protein
MLTATCYCDDCQAAAREIEALGHGPPVADADGGTTLSLLRIDTFTVTKGNDLLTPHKLRPASKTSRMVGRCCNSAMYLSFTDGRFWVSAMSDRIVGDKPTVEARLAVKDRDPAMPWPDHAPRYLTYPKRFLFRLFGQWIAMKLSGAWAEKAPA